MSNHLHLIVFTEALELSNVLRDFKKFTAYKILESINKEPESRREWLLHMFKYFAAVNSNNRNFQFWIQDNHPIELWSLPVIWQKLNYIHDNPVRAGIVSDPTHYLYSSATDYYCGRNGLLEIDLMEPIGPMLPSGYYS
jgi:REP element-mobilizing transposase RayT